jgi:alpha-glucosidase
LTLLSPDNQITVSLSDDAEKPQYHVSFKGETVINPSRLGLVFKQIGEMGQDFKISQHTRSKVSHTWQLPWGERQTIKDNHNGLIASLSNGKMSFDIEFKAFNDGLGFRYRVPKQAGLTQFKRLDITDELTEFTLPDARNTTAWWIPGRG